MKIKKIIKKIARIFNLEIKKYNSETHAINQTIKVLKYCKIDMVLDIGANTGQFAQELRENGYEGVIISFEPLSSARKKLIKNSSKDSKWIIKNQYALGSEEGETEINVSNNSVSSSILNILESHTRAAKYSEYIDKEKIKILTLDKVMEKYNNENKNIFIKIDTQGYELEVIKGGIETIKKSKAILCELSLVELYKNQATWKQIISILEKEEYSLWCIQEGFTNPNTGQTLQVDGLFLKEEITHKIYKES